MSSLGQELSSGQRACGGRGSFVPYDATHPQRGEGRGAGKIWSQHTTCCRQHSWRPPSTQKAPIFLDWVSLRTLN